MTNEVNQTRLAPDAERLIKLAWVALIWSVILSPIAQTLASPATAGPEFYSNVTPVVHSQSGPISSLLGLLAQFGPIGAGAAAIVVAVRYPRPLVTGLPLWFAAMFLAFGMFLAAFFATQPSISTALVRLPILFSAAFFLPTPGLSWFIKRCRGAIEFYTSLTLAALVLAPSWVLTFDYGGSLLPGLDIRLHGIAGHANNFAIILLVYLVLGWILPARTRWEYGWLMVIVASLLLTQSKTVLALAALLYVLRMYYLPGMVRIVAPYLIAVAGTIVALILTTIRPQWTSELVESIFREDVVTLTGRTVVWAWTIDVWRENPLFGYGHDLWNQEMGMNFASYYGWLPGHAHNQFVQTLGQAGLIGLLGLTILSLLLLGYGIRYHRITAGATLALSLSLLIRSVTELPLQADIGESFFAFFVTISLFVLVSAEAPHAAKIPRVVDQTPQSSVRDRQAVPPLGMVRRVT